MYSITGFGAADAQTLAAARAAWPKCWSVEASECNNNRQSVYPGCAAMWKLWDKDEDTYKRLLDETPFCPDPNKDYSLNVVHIAMIAGGALLGVVLSRLLT